jgi:hypothetical protein
MLNMQSWPSFWKYLRLALFGLVFALRSYWPTLFSLNHKGVILIRYELVICKVPPLIKLKHLKTQFLSCILLCRGLLGMYYSSLMARWQNAVEGKSHNQCVLDVVWFNSWTSNIPHRHVIPETWWSHMDLLAMLLKSGPHIGFGWSKWMQWNTTGFEYNLVSNL